MRRSASGQALCRSQALRTGHTTSKRPCTITAGMCRIFVHVLEQLVRPLEEAAVHEVVALDARERRGELRIVEPA